MRFPFLFIILQKTRRTLMKMTTRNPVLAKIRLFLIILASCVIATCLFLIIIHPEAWIFPTCLIVAMIIVLLVQRKLKSKI